MDKFCVNCGFKLLDDPFICPNCGMILGEASQDPEQDQIVYDTVQAPAEDMIEPAPAQKYPSSKKIKVSWWMVVVPVVVIVAILGALLWYPLLMMVSPRMALSLAWSRTQKDLAQRYEGSPFAALDRGMNWLQDGNLFLELDYSDSESELLASLLLQSDMKKQQLQLVGDVTMDQESFNASLYMDHDKMAALISGVGTGRYGIRFDSLREDIKKSVLADMFTDEDIDELDAMIQQLRDSFTEQIDYAALAKPYQAIIQEYMDSLEIEKGKDDVKLGDKRYTCDTITMTLDQDSLFDLCNELVDMLEKDKAVKKLYFDSLSGMVDKAEFDSLWEDYMDALRDSLDEIEDQIDSECVITYYIRRNRVVNVLAELALEIDGEEGVVCVDINYGDKPGTSDIVTEISLESDGEDMAFTVISKVEQEDEKYDQTLDLELENAYGETLEAVLKTKWNQNSGKLTFQLSLEAEGESVEYSFGCDLQAFSNGFMLTIDQNDLNDLFESMDAGTAVPSDVKLELSISCTEGVDIREPEFTNLDQWDKSFLEELEELVHRFEEFVSGKPDGYAEYRIAVKDNLGDPVSDVLISVYDSHNNLISQGYTGPTGVVYFDLPADTYTICWYDEFDRFYGINYILMVHGSYSTDITLNWYVVDEL